MSEDYFTITREVSGPGDTAQLVLAGEFDLSVRDELRAVLLDLVDSRKYATIDVDVAAVTFIDSEAISAIIDGYLAAAEKHITFHLTRATRVVERVFTILGLAHLFADPAGSR